MVTSSDVSLPQAFQVNIPEAHRSTVAEMKPEHLVEVTVSKSALVIDTQGVSAHDSLYGRGIEAIGK